MRRVLAFVLIAVALTGEAAEPEPLTGHVGNMFLAGENVLAVVREHDASWRLLDYDNNVVARVNSTNGSVALGKLPVGYYTLQPESGNGRQRVSLGVLHRLASPGSKTSPIAVDVAMAQFHSKTQQQAVAKLCTLAGVSWVRDRFKWQDVEPEKNQFARAMPADDSARAQAEAGLQVLQVHCDTPPWAGTNAKRFPVDLRDAYQFMKSVATRWRGKVSAFEPWNEADTPNFGGHIGNEIAAYQKACYLGLKAGNPDAIACQSALASPQPNVLADLNANEVWPYFDTLNFHHYCPPEEYRNVYSAFRSVSASKPLWVTEFNLPVTWSGDAKAQEPSDADMGIQAERVPQLFATALNEGPACAFYFLLSHYAEGQVQFGLLHEDLTPRPAFVALAAVGRILADARALGHLVTAEPLRAFIFRARPDGEERDVVVAWTANGTNTGRFPVTPLAVYDHLGRARTNTPALTFSTAPLFIVCAKDSLKAWPIHPRPASTPAPVKSGSLSQVVLQVVMPETKTLMSLSAYACSTANAESIPVFAYNFSEQKISGTLAVTAPPGWNLSFPKRLDLSPGERKGLTLVVDPRGKTTTPSDTIRINGDFGAAGSAIASFRLAPQPFSILQDTHLPIRSTYEPARWQIRAAPGASATATNAIRGVTFQAQFKGDRWVYPVVILPPDERPATNTLALAATITISEGSGNFRAIFEEENGSAYFAPFYPQPKAGETVEVIAMFDAVLHGEGWSAADDNGQLDPQKIKSLRFGCNADTEKAIFTIRELRWVGRQPLKP